jgi:hypothetical protein
MQRLQVLIRRTIDRHWTHPGAAGRFTNTFGIATIGLIALHIRLHGLRRHELHRVPKFGDFPRSIVGATTGFQADEAGRQLREQGQDLFTRHTSMQHDVPLSIDAVELKHLFCCVNP